MKHAFFFGLLFVFGGCYVPTDSDVFAEDEVYVGSLEISTKKFDVPNYASLVGVDRESGLSNKTNFPIPKDTSYGVVFRVYDFRRSGQSPYRNSIKDFRTEGDIINSVSAVMNSEGFRPARIEELLEYLIHHKYPEVPENQNIVNLVALGSNYSGKEGNKDATYYPMLEKWKSSLSKTNTLLKVMPIIPKDDFSRSNLFCLFLGVKDVR